MHCFGRWGDVCLNENFLTKSFSFVSFKMMIMMKVRQL